MSYLGLLGIVMDPETYRGVLRITRGSLVHLAKGC